ncbi:hypothetical protein N865_21520 [Intrasporangium oryzae NRRL B-24470]|uniref:Glycosyltransferase RgtA/B/C/D-like domain-containing protein n=1 Tax=Intrasporangium oryzae NRRL B-24470 TaxID=1386089 RepID=W9G4H2_9MICO|nr:hypothetical protein N865_21520 [Intrasporangium oryzae NRRL B-24470]
MLLVVLLMASAVTVGADTNWLVALGNDVLTRRSIPVGVPFAAADSSSWVNVPALGEVLFALVDRVGPLGLPLAQLAVDAALLALMALGARRRGAGSGATAAVLALTCLGMLPALGVIRAQLFSLVPFAALLLLLRTEHDRPTARIWFAVPLIALWGNLHGAVLVGLAVTGCYLLFSRARGEPLVTLGVGIACLMALFANPAHVRTVSYYLGVLGNEAARRGTELWARPQLDKPFDLLLVVAAAVLATLALSRRLPLWEYMTLGGLALGTATAARHGVWVLIFLSAPAAAGLTGLMARRGKSPRQHDARAATTASVVLLVLGAVGVMAILANRVGIFTTSPDLLREIRSAAAGRPVLATEPLAESLAAEGIPVWMSNPIDAFSTNDQAAYLDFVAGQGPESVRALGMSNVVVAPTGSPAAALAQLTGFSVVRRVEAYDIMTRQ